MSNNKQSSVDKEFVPYEEALALKELGFDEPCFAFFQVEYTELLPTMVDDDEEYRLTGYRTCSNLEMPKNYTLAPTFSQALRWFRERKLLGLVCPIDDWNSWSYSVQGEDCMSPFFQMVYCEEYKTYGEAELACLKKLIEIVKEGKNENI